MLRTDLIASVATLIQRHADERGTKVAFADAIRQVTYGELAARTANLAGHLADLGVGAGDTVAIFLPNCVDWIESSFAITRAGAIGVPISYDATESEIAYRLQDASCKVVVTTDERAVMIEAIKAQCPTVATTILVERGEDRCTSLRHENLAAATSKSKPRDSSSIHDAAYNI
jgi:acyl-CoA synthetase (AMP-forming)/AMP-acid ligase II